MPTVRDAVRRLRHEIAELSPPRWTLFRLERARRAPNPDAFARFGEGTWIAPPARFEHPDRVELGDGVGLMEHVNIAVIDERRGGDSAARVVIGDGTRLARFATIVCAVGVTIGKGVSSSDWISITDTWEPPLGAPSAVPGPAAARVVISDGAYLSAGCTILPGVTVGEGAYIGEGAVVMTDVPAHSKVYGNPGVVIRQHEDSGWVGPEWP